MKPTSQTGQEARPTPSGQEDELIEGGSGTKRIIVRHPVSALSEWGLYVFAGLVISGRVETNLVTIWTSALACCLLAFATVIETLRWTLALYAPRFAYQPTFRGRLTRRQWLGRSKSGTLFRLSMAYFRAVYAFALAYLFLARVSSVAFSVKHLSLLDAIYFSVTTIATVGYGDIAPVSTAARILVISEVFIGLLFAILVFSVIATFLRDEHDRAGRDATSST